MSIQILQYITLACLLLARTIAIFMWLSRIQNPKLPSAKYTIIHWIYFLLAFLLQYWDMFPFNFPEIALTFIRLQGFNTYRTYMQSCFGVKFALVINTTVLSSMQATAGRDVRLQQQTGGLLYAAGAATAGPCSSSSSSICSTGNTAAAVRRPTAFQGPPRAELQPTPEAKVTNVRQKWKVNFHFLFLRRHIPETGVTCNLMIVT